MKQIILLFVFVSLGAVQTVQAETAQTQIRKTQIKQQQQIEQGLHSGALTRQEAKQLTLEQTDIARLRRKANKDGFVSRQERALITRKQAIAADNIFRMKRNKKSVNSRRRL